MTTDLPKRKGESVLLLRVTTDYNCIDDLVIAVRPQVASICAPGGRLILEHDLQQTFLVDGAEMPSGSGWPHITIRRARPIINAEYVTRLLEALT